jgi:hypothetical protein
MRLASSLSRSAVLIGAFALAGCAAPAPLPPGATATSVPSPAATDAFPTFSPTATVTPAPSATAAPGLSQEVGPLVFTAEFTSDAGWRLGSDPEGGASLSGETLVLAVSRPNASRFVIAPAPPLGDFLLQASVRAGLCSGADEIGVLFRVSPQGDHYRFTLDCQGDVRVTRILGSGAVVLAGPADAASAIPGSPAENQITVLARGENFTFFVNGNEVLQARDPFLASGLSGFFVRSASLGQTTAALTAFTLRDLRPAATPTVPPASG